MGRGTLVVLLLNLFLISQFLNAPLVRADGIDKIRNTPRCKNRMEQKLRDVLSACRKESACYFGAGWIESGKFSYEQLGTSKEEVAKIKRRQALQRAESKLKWSRRGSITGALFSNNARVIKNIVGRSDIAYEELGTSEEEVGRFIIQADNKNKKRLKERLKQCRRMCVYGIARAMKIGFEENKFSYEELGTTREEVQKIVRDLAIERAKKRLQYCREGSLIPSYKLLKSYLEEDKVTYEDLGIAKEEIEGFAYRVEGFETAWSERFDICP